MWWKLNERCGKHVDRDLKEYNPGDVVETEQDLGKLFPLKFTQVHEEQTKTFIPDRPEIPGPDSSEDKKENPLKKPSKSEESEHGKECTDDFPLAVTANLKVYTKSQWYTIIDPDDGLVLNDKKLRMRDVNTLLKEYQPDGE